MKSKVVSIALVLLVSLPVMAAAREREKTRDPHDRSPLVRIVKLIVRALEDLPGPPKP